MWLDSVTATPALTWLMKCRIRTAFIGEALYWPAVEAPSPRWWAPLIACIVSWLKGYSLFQQYNFCTLFYLCTNVATCIWATYNKCRDWMGVLILDVLCMETFHCWWFSDLCPTCMIWRSIYVHWLWSFKLWLLNFVLCCLQWLSSCGGCEARERRRRRRITSCHCTLLSTG